MSRPANNQSNFAEKSNFAETWSVLESKQVWQYETGTRNNCRDVPKQAFNALQRPDDFPPIEAAIVPGDRVAIAVDPNVPAVVEVIQGTMKALGQTDASEIDIVLWDEASEETLAAIQEEVGESTRVVRHQSSHRESLRYLAADDDADPIYLNRLLVDADFVLPIVAGRPLDASSNHDLTGVFPHFADSTSRNRHRAQQAAKRQDAKNDSAYLPETAWLLGVHILVSVTASTTGQAGEIIAGTPAAIRKKLTPSRRLPDEFPPPASLVIASLDGDAQQQTWCNAARAIKAASRYVQPGGTIVLWSAIEERPSGQLLSLGDSEDSEWDDDDQPSDDFPRWDASIDTARTLARIAAEYRLLIHSHLDDESMGLGSVASTEELARLSRSFDDCGVLRAAQFAGTTIDTPHQIT
jgi:hypothetical protein